MMSDRQVSRDIIGDKQMSRHRIGDTQVIGDMMADR